MKVFALVFSAFALVFSIFALILSIFLLMARPASALDFLYPAEVERVIDADTIVVDLHLGLGVVLNDQYIRLYGIDAWETRGEERPLGLLAKQYVIDKLEQEKTILTIEIEIRPEWGSNGRGKYGRWLGVIYVDGVNLNFELVKEGHAEFELVKEGHAEYAKY